VADTSELGKMHFGAAGKSTDAPKRQIRAKSKKVGNLGHADDRFGPNRRGRTIPEKRMGIMTHGALLSFPPIELT